MTKIRRDRRAAKKNGEKPDKTYSPKRLTKLKMRIAETIEFLSYDIWRIDSKSLSKKTNIFYDAIKIIILTVRNTVDLRLGLRAASLTYSIILSVVPFLAVLFAIARGFGFENILKGELFNYLGTYHSDLDALDSQSVIASAVIRSIDNSLEYAKGGVFAGVGVVLLLYTVYALFSNIEGNFNRIWQIKKSRPVYRQITDYFALVIIIPVMMFLNSGLSIMISSSAWYSDKLSPILNPVISQFLKILPYILNTLALTLLYKFMPNTKVKFINAVIAGVVAGFAFQVFQMIYLSGFLWITKYNAIYGTFAAIPLMLLWMQLSWYIVLVGVELSFASQNVRKFSFEKETKTISRKYRDFFTLIIVTAIVKQFEAKRPPLTANELSEKCEVPVGLTNRIIDDLQEMHVISPTPSYDHTTVMAYQPAIDINQLSVNYLMKKIDRFGSEDFNIDTYGRYCNEWDALVESRTGFYERNRDVMLKDL